METLTCKTKDCHNQIQHPKSGLCTPCYQRDRVSKLTDPCNTPGCPRKIAHKDPPLCEPCYQRYRINSLTEECSTPDCHKTIANIDLQLCYACYRLHQKRKQTRPCSTVGCQRTVVNSISNLCAACTEQLRLSKMPPCTFKGCDRLAKVPRQGFAQDITNNRKRGNHCGLFVAEGVLGISTQMATSL